MYMENKTGENRWDTLTYDQKNRLLFEKEEALLKQFLEKGAISKEQYDKGLRELEEKLKSN